MIRLANKHDTTEIIEMMQAFRKESQIVQFKDLDNQEYWHELLAGIFAGRGFIYIEEGKGLIIGLIVPSLWCNKTYALHELAWYVKPEQRNTTIGARLFHSFINEAKKLKEQDRIKYFVMSKLSSSPDIKYDKYGFTKLDENWIQ